MIVWAIDEDDVIFEGCKWPVLEGLLKVFKSSTPVVKYM